MATSVGLEVNSRRTYPGLFRALAELLKPWKPNPYVFPDPLSSPDRYVVGTVSKVNYEVFPLVLYCKNCRRLHWYTSAKAFKGHNPNGGCEQGCKGERMLVQYPYAYIHEAGDIQPLIAPRGPENNYRNLAMFDNGSFRGSYWYYTKTKKPIREGAYASGLGARMTKEKGAGRKIMRGIHLSQGEKYYGRTLSVVDIDSETIEQRRIHPDFAKIQLGAYLRLIDLSPADYRKMFAGTEDGVSAANHALFAKLEAMKDKVPPEVFAALAATYKQNLPGGSSITGQVDQVFGGSPPVHLVDSDGSLNEYIYSRYELESAQTLDGFIQDALANGDTDAGPILTEARTVAEATGFAEMVLHEKFPVILASVGYTRGSYEPNDGVVLRPFSPDPADPNQRGKVPIPIVSTLNEAVMYSLSARRVLAWLQVNGYAGAAPATALATEPAARGWVYANLPWDNSHAMAARQLGAEQEEDAATLAFRLLHTMSHQMIHSSRKHVGLDMNSLAEYLFPSALSGAIYVAKHHEFSLGALVTTFRHDLARWLKATRESASSCLFDPVCRARGGACHACGYLKFSCQHRNQGLSRCYLVGGYVTSGEIRAKLVGYWSPEVTAKLQ